MKLNLAWAPLSLLSCLFIKIDFEKEREWVHLRKSNTEPIIRIYAESQNEKKADELAKRIIEDIKSLI